ncbi:hypothetical protein RintRC_3504 [Richelia intracellularis]|nr:hypothetical protein RintRC_3504 [Richelia intracellularis]
MLLPGKYVANYGDNVAVKNNPAVLIGNFAQLLWIPQKMMAINLAILSPVYV